MIQLDPEQQKAVDLMCTAKACVITGGPGTGKSTLTKAALERFHKKGTRYELAAPTGKAARRLSEVTGQSAQTIHRLLGYGPTGFMYNEFHPFTTEVVIVDETSMLDLNLASSLLKAVDPKKTRIVFIGDVNQLPPVGPGAFFRDMIESGKIPTVRLKTLHRAAAKSWVCRNAPKILSGEALELEDQVDFEFHELDHDAGQFIGEAVKNLVLREDLVGQDIQVLAPLKNRTGGVVELNSILQKALNPGAGYGWEIKKQIIRLGDRVMQTKNDYKLGVFNGEVGKVVGLTTAELLVDFGLEKIRYNHEQAQGLLLAYACTVHKYQGSEVQNVVVVCHSDHNIMLTRQLLYTAITRAQERVFIVGDRGGVGLALKTMKDATRKTLLQNRLLGEQL